MLYIIPRKMRLRQVTSANGRVRDVRSCSDHVRIMPESSAIVGDDSAVFRIFLSYILGCHFSWQTQYLEMLGHSCCSAHCE